MKNRMLFSIKQIMKMMLQNMILPCVYGFWRLVYFKKTPERIVFADAHHDELPFSMLRIHEVLEKRGYEITDEIHNYGAMSQFRAAILAIRFMRLYADARFVFICDNFLPVASCKKRKETTVVQLWHSCGLLKKMGYATDEDVPANYKGNVYRNYDLVTVSAPCCVEPLTFSMRQAPGIVQPIGVSRTDSYFDADWIASCKEDFYRQYPEAKNKKIILWAPTFRGNAADPYQIGVEQITALEEQLKDDLFLIRKVHPYIDAKYHLSNCEIPTERLLPVTDVMITDYSSVVCDYMVFEKPYVMFAPDLEEFEKKRGFYEPYDSLSPYIVTDEKKLKERVMAALEETDHGWVAERRAYHLASCDGHATEHILKYLGLN